MIKTTPKRLARIEAIQNSAIRIFTKAYDDLNNANVSLAELIKSEEDNISVHDFNISVANQHITNNNKILNKLKDFI